MQQLIHTLNHPIHTAITIPGSKSITYRALLLAALAEGQSKLSRICLNDETQVLIHALRQLGVVIQLDEKSRSCLITGCNGLFPQKQGTIWCQESFTLTRFLMAACAITAGVFYFDGSLALRKKPISHLLRLLTRQGVQLIPSGSNKMPFTLAGTDALQGGEIHIDQTLHSVVSALLLIAPYAHMPFIFTLSEPSTHPYIDLTCSMMAEFGVLVHRMHQGQWMVPIPQRYEAKDYHIEPDFSIAAYFFAAVAICGGQLTIQPMKRYQSKQSNIKFLSVLEKMGCQVIETHSGLSVKSTGELHGIEINMHDYSGAFLALLAIAPFAKSPTKITHINHLSKNKLKRLMLMRSELIKRDIRVEMGQDWIEIFPGTPRGGNIHSHDDRHLAMAFAIIGLKVPHIVIEGTECVDRAYPEFFTQWNRLGEAENIPIAPEDAKL